MTKDSGPVIEGTLHSADGQGLVRMKSRYATDIDDLGQRSLIPSGWPGGMDTLRASFGLGASSRPK